MSIFSSKAVRSTVAVVFTLSAMFVWGHERSVQTSSTQVASASTGTCVVVDGNLICP